MKSSRSQAWCITEQLATVSTEVDLLVLLSQPKNGWSSHLWFDWQGNPPAVFG